MSIHCVFLFPQLLNDSEIMNEFIKSVYSLSNSNYLLQNSLIQTGSSWFVTADLTNAVFSLPLLEGAQRKRIYT